MGCAWERGNPHPETASPPQPPRFPPSQPRGTGTAGATRCIGAVQQGAHGGGGFVPGGAPCIEGAPPPPPRASRAPWRPELRCVSPPAMPASRGRQQHAALCPPLVDPAKPDGKWRRGAPPLPLCEKCGLRYPEGTARGGGGDWGHVWSGRAAGSRELRLNQRGLAQGRGVGAPILFLCSRAAGSGTPAPPGGTWRGPARSAQPRWGAQGCGVRGWSVSEPSWGCPFVCASIRAAPLE